MHALDRGSPTACRRTSSEGIGKELFMGRIGNEGVCKIPCIEKVILRGVLRGLGALLLAEGDIPLGRSLKGALVIF